MRALARRGLRVCGVKCGPDYIDPAFHAAATGRESFNLDFVDDGGRAFRPARATRRRGGRCHCRGRLDGAFRRRSRRAGADGRLADIAAHLSWPVLLVMDVSGQAQSAAAISRGVAAHDARVTLAGVMLNRVASERHRKLAQEAIEAIGIRSSARCRAMVGSLCRSVIWGWCRRARPRASKPCSTRWPSVSRPMSISTPRSPPPPQVGCGRARSARALRPPGQRIAVARDLAFSFFYPHLARSWRESGAEIIFFSPLADEAPPEKCDALLASRRLSGAACGPARGGGEFSRRASRFATTRAVHGECGGYMTLGRTLTDASGAPIHGRPARSGRTSFAAAKLHLGYRRARLSADCHCLGARRSGFAVMNSITRPSRDESASPLSWPGTPIRRGAARRASSRPGLGVFFHVIG